MSSELAAARSRWLRVPKKCKNTLLIPGFAKEGDSGAGTLGKEEQHHRSRGGTAGYPDLPGHGRGKNRARRLPAMGLASRSSRSFSSSSQPSCHTLHATYCQYCLERAPTAPKCFFTASYLALPHCPRSGTGPCSSAQGCRGRGAVPGLPEPPRSSSSTRTQQPSPRRAGSPSWPMAGTRVRHCRARGDRADLTSWGVAGEQPRAGPALDRRGLPVTVPSTGTRPNPTPAPSGPAPAGREGDGDGEMPGETPGLLLPPTNARGTRRIWFFS